MNRLIKLSLAGLVFSCAAIVSATPGKSLVVTPFTNSNYPEVEPAYAYDFSAPVAADILNQDPNSYSPSYSERYFMSIFGPRYKSVSSSNIEYFDFHKGMDFTAVVTHEGVDYDDNSPPMIVSRCDGVVSAIEEGSDEEMETTEEGRWVEVRCHEEFNGNDWGHIYMAYRHLASIEPDIEIDMPIHKNDAIGLMGESGHTSKVHLHYSVMRHNGQTRVNVNPMRVFDPQATPHLHSILNDAAISQLSHTLDTALFRIAVPHQQTAIRALTVTLEGTDYARTYDFEAVSENAGDLRDHNNYVEGLSLFAYSYNRGQTAYARYLSTVDGMPQAYPASDKNTASAFYPILNNYLQTQPAYILDVLVSDLPLDFNVADLKIELIDIYGHGVRAYGDASAEYYSIAFTPIQTTHNDGEEAANGTMDLSSSDLELVEDGSKGLQHIGVRFPEIALPNNANIHHAHIQFSADETDDEATHLNIRAEDEDTSAEFTLDDFNISQRNTTNVAVQWQPEEWELVNEVTDKQATPNLADIIQPVVSRAGWTELSALSFIISGTGKRVADSSEGTARKDPYLYVEYSDDDVQNQSPNIHLTTPIDDEVFIGLQAISIDATAADSDGSVALVRFFVNDIEIANDANVPYSIQWVPTEFGSYQIHTIVEDDQGSVTLSSTVTVHIADQRLELSLSHGDNDVEERESGSIAKKGSDLELGYDDYVSSKYGLSGHQTVGLRFTNVAIPNTATITRAYVQFTSTKAEDEPVSLLIEAENSGDAAEFAYSSFGVSNRLAVNTVIPWMPEVWSGPNLSGQAQRTPDLTAMLQEVIEHSDWDNNHSLVLKFYANNNSLSARTARSYNGNSDQSPQLIIEYINN